MVCEINYGVMKFSELLFGQIAARLIITFNVTLAREQWKSRGKTSTNFRFHHASVLISLYYYWNVIDTNRNCHARFHEKWINYHFRDKHLPPQL